jgi:two-component system chemotaxis sensor kinase CheA
MPVVSFDPMGAVEADGRQPALVFTDSGRTMALLVDAVVDILDTELDIHSSSSMPGVTGSAVIAGRATELIDASYFCELAFQGWSEPTDWSEAAAGGASDEADWTVANPTGSAPLEVARAA